MEREEDHGGSIEGDTRRFPRSPGRGLHPGDRGGVSGWDTIDKLTVTVCALMPMGMQIVEFIPKTLQEE